MRTIIELPLEQLSALGVICDRQHISRAEAVRRAVAAYIEAERVSPGHAAFGVWSDWAFSATSFERGQRQQWDGRVK